MLLVLISVCSSSSRSTSVSLSRSFSSSSSTTTSALSFSTSCSAMSTRAALRSDVSRRFFAALAGPVSLDDALFFDALVVFSVFFVSFFESSSICADLRLLSFLLDDDRVRSTSSASSLRFGCWVNAADDDSVLSVFEGDCVAFFAKKVVH